MCFDGRIKCQNEFSSITFANDSSGQSLQQMVTVDCKVFIKKYWVKQERTLDLSGDGRVYNSGVKTVQSCSANISGFETEISFLRDIFRKYHMTFLLCAAIFMSTCIKTKNESCTQNILFIFTNFETVSMRPSWHVKLFSCQNQMFEF